jgi:glucose-6-phosphate isomerase
LSTKTSVHLGSYRFCVDEALQKLKADRIMARIWAKDHTLWKESCEGIGNRLNWLEAPQNMEEKIASIRPLAKESTAEGYTHAVLLGMGGSSLAAEVFLKTFGVKDGCPNLLILDSIDPAAIKDCERALDFSKTLFIVSSKSGTTIETISLLKYFYHRTIDTLGRNQAGRHFVAITDSQSPLSAIANNYHFRATFYGDPNIGGRYSALAYFGLLPAVIIGVDMEPFVESARSMMEQECLQINNSAYLSEGARLGTILGTMALQGRDKATFLLSPRIASFGLWLEQMIAESTGKEGRGILPVVSEHWSSPDRYGNDRLFIFIGLRGNEQMIKHQSIAAGRAGHPVIVIILHDLYALGGQFFLWEMATSVAGYWLRVNPFDQPDVELSKKLVRQMLTTCRGEMSLPSDFSCAGSETLKIDNDMDTIKSKLGSFLRGAKPGAYIGLHAYIRQTGETDELFRRLRGVLRDQLGLAATVGYGPRFLHSTGQLHKGDSGNGLFIQLTADDPEDISIPDEMDTRRSSISFGALKARQADGDRLALIHAGRRVIRLYLGGDALGALNRLVSSLEKD